MSRIENKNLMLIYDLKILEFSYITFSPRIIICLLSNCTSGKASSFKMESAPPGGDEPMSFQ
jgi:hypothetical protein